MEGEIQFCPNCILVPFINIIDKQIHIKCNCGYDKNLQISDYLSVLLLMNLLYINPQ